MSKPHNSQNRCRLTSRLIGPKHLCQTRFWIHTRPEIIFFILFFLLPLIKMSSRRGRYISDSDEEELDYGQSSKRTKLTNGHTEEMEEDRAVTETEDQAMVVDDDG